ncbi:MAG: MiaB/RimO family radical SAM methylthiotransferase [Candidatus Geothermincolia bacterium]
MGKIAIITLGCKVNRSESDELSGELAALGYSVQADPAGADLCVVHTCTVTGESDSKSRKAVRRARSEGIPVIATGCMIQAGGMAEMPGVLQMREGTKDLMERIADYAGAPTRHPKPFQARSRAFLKVQDGCDRHCSYCIVPRARGGSRSRAADGIFALARRSLAAGCRELVLTGVNLMDYDYRGMRLAELLDGLASLEGLGRIRLSSLEPDALTPESLTRLLRNPSVCPHLHLPLQSGSDRVLAAMQRGYDVAGFCELVSAARSAVPHVAITTDVMVGFPGEDEADVAGTLSVMEKLKFARAHAFRYSRREQTAAASMPGQIAADSKAERAARVRAQGLRLQEDFVKAQVGEVRQAVLISRVEEEWRGLTENYVSVELKHHAPMRAGELCRVRVTGAAGLKALGEPLPKGERR